MSKLRSVSTAFWSDPFIEDLTPSEKLLFLYFITNEKTNMLGIYELSIKKISFETGLNKDVIENALKEFETLKKVKHINNYIILVNFMKNQNYNPNMKKSAIDIYNALPNELKNKELIIDKSNVEKGFESLLKHLGMVRKIEYEVKYEVKYELQDELEDEEEKPEPEPKNNIPDFSEFLIYAKQNEPLINENTLKLKYESWKVNDWKNGNDKKIKNWKSTLLNTLPYIEKNNNNGKQSITTATTKQPLKSNLAEYLTNNGQTEVSNTQRELSEDTEYIELE